MNKKRDAWKGIPQGARKARVTLLGQGYRQQQGSITEGSLQTPQEREGWNSITEFHLIAVVVAVAVVGSAAVVVVAAAVAVDGTFGLAEGPLPQLEATAVGMVTGAHCCWGPLHPRVENFCLWSMLQKTFVFAAWRCWRGRSKRTHVTVAENVTVTVPPPPTGGDDS